jgi:prepilin-type N-terminal cleavage/methylation domain-containing protein
MDVFGALAACIDQLRAACSAGPAVCGVPGASRGEQKGFSLTELLVTLSITLALAALATAAIAAAKGSQKRLATREVIARLDSIIAPHYASYRRLDVAASSAAARGQAVRAVVEGDLPDRWATVAELASREDSTLTARQRVYAATWQAIPDKAVVMAFHGSAECLFMIVTQGSVTDCLDCRSLLGDIGDVDDDGMPEFLDAWGRPIGFVLWPTALRLPPASDARFFSDRPPFESSVATVAEARARVSTPLLFSAGPDGIAGLDPAAGPLDGAADNITNFDEEARR